MVIRGNMVTVCKLKHPCIRCCAENTFFMEGSNSQKSIRSQTVLPDFSELYLLSILLSVVELFSNQYAFQ